MPTISNKTSQYALWFASLLMLACAGGPPEPQPASPLPGAQAQALNRIPCQAPADCSARGGSCQNGGCRADNECTTAADCSSGSPCVADVNFGGLCALPADRAPVPEPTAMCTSDGRCPAGQTCDADGLCRAIHVCRTNKDCHKAQVCDAVTGRCVPRPPRACRTSADCPTGEVCDPVTDMCGAPSCTPQPDGTCK